MRCLSCNADNDPSATRCANCGEPLDRLDAAPVLVTGRPWPEPPARRRHTGLIVLLVVALVMLAAVVAVGVVVRHRQDSASAAPPATGSQLTEAERAQAGAIDQLLDRSIASRVKLNSAIQQIGSCQDTTAAIAALKSVVAERRQEIGDLAAADLSSVPQGTTLRSELTSAWQLAVDADQAYADWAAPTAGGNCANTTARAAAYDRANATSGQAQSAKAGFVTLWAPLAAQFGLAARSAQDI